MATSDGNNIYEARNWGTFSRKEEEAGDRTDWFREEYWVSGVPPGRCEDKKWAPAGRRTG